MEVDCAEHLGNHKSSTVVRHATPMLAAMACRAISWWAAHARCGVAARHSPTALIPRKSLLAARSAQMSAPT